MRKELKHDNYKLPCETINDSIEELKELRLYLSGKQEFP